MKRRKEILKMGEGLCSYVIGCFKGGSKRNREADKARK